MALNERIWVVCPSCNGQRCIVAKDGEVDPCLACDLTGRDAATEAKLNGIAGRLPEIARTMRLSARCADLPELVETYNREADDLEELHQLLTGHE